MNPLQFFAASTLLLATSFFSSKTLAVDSRYYRNVPDSQSVIVFVHGLFGDGTSTWTAANGAYWPDLLTKDKFFDNYSIYIYEYPTTMSNKEFSIDELAENMRLYLDADDVSSRNDIIFLTHSMGGLVTRAYLLKNKKQAGNTRLLYFYSTPTTGSEVVSIASLIHTNPQLSKLKPMQSQDYLADLQRQWLAANFEIPSFCAYETKSTYGFNIVTQASASNLCNRRLDPLDADHITIVKPETLRDPRYLAFRVAVREVPAGTSSQKIQNETNDRLKRIEEFLARNDRTDSGRFSSSEGFEKKYPLGFSLFYSDGGNIKYFAGNTDPNFQFDPATIKVISLNDIRFCFTGIRAKIQGMSLTFDNSCVNAPPGSVANIGNFLGAKFQVESLGRSDEKVAWIIGFTR